MQSCETQYITTSGQVAAERVAAGEHVAPLCLPSTPWGRRPKRGKPPAKSPPFYLTFAEILGADNKRVGVTRKLREILSSTRTFGWTSHLKCDIHMRVEAYCAPNAQEDTRDAHLINAPIFKKSY